MIEGAVLHPGDALDPPQAPVDVLLIPVGGPWMKVGESIDYLRALSPRVAVPVHQAGLSRTRQQMHHELLKSLAPAGTEVVVLDHAVPHTL